MRVYVLRPLGAHVVCPHPPSIRKSENRSQKSGRPDFRYSVTLKEDGEDRGIAYIEYGLVIVGRKYFVFGGSADAERVVSLG